MQKILALATLLLSGLTLQGQVRPAITGIAFVRLYATNPEASAAFYDHDLGYTRVKMRTFDRYALSERQWFEVAPLPSPVPVSRLAAVGFMTRDVEGMQRYLRAHSVTIFQKLADGQFAVKDPEGNLVVFVQAGSVKMATAAFSPRESSHRIIHAGFAVQSAEAEDKFYKDVLGFAPNWHGGRTDNTTDWISLRVPEGTDWIEYMLNGGPHPEAKQLGVMNHFSLGVAQMSTATQALARNGCTSANCSKNQVGRDGKVQMNVFDPDLTRVEFMEFKVSGTTCCSPILGKPPVEAEDQ